MAEQNQRQASQQPAEQHSQQRQAGPRSRRMRQAQTLPTDPLQRLQALANKSPQTAQLQRLQEMANNSPQTAQLRRLQAMAQGAEQRAEAEPTTAKPEPAKAKPNLTGLPDHLKSNLEALSSLSMDAVRVHYNSTKPAQLTALAYAQGTDIHLGPGQEQHLPHEAWHVVQQAQGRVRPMLQMAGGMAVNDDVGLEREADVMGVEALQLGLTPPSEFHVRLPTYLQMRGRKTAKLRVHETSSQVLRSPFADKPNHAGHPVAQLQLAEFAKEVMTIVKRFEGQIIPEEEVNKVRKMLMTEMREEFEKEYEEFVKSEIKSERRIAGASEKEVLTALREYVKALTSSLQAAKGWEDVAILHKRKSKKKGPENRMKDEREKYSLIARHTADIWETGDHEQMENTGQVYGPATKGLHEDLENGGYHTWGSNAAWLLGHMHAGHRFIQVVPHTEDNLMRGSKDDEVGALAYEALKLRENGYTKGQQADSKLWTEYLPTDNTINATLTTLARSKKNGKEEAADIRQKLVSYDIWAENIKVEDVIELDMSRGDKSVYQYVSQSPTWTDKNELDVSSDYYRRDTTSLSK